MRSLIAVLSVLSCPAAALACGGVFCDAGPGSQPQLIEQDGERILFGRRDDGRMVAVIQIAYEGPASDFSWILPVTGKPEVAVATDAVFDALDAATAPVVQQTWTYENCESTRSSFEEACAGSDMVLDAGGGDLVQVDRTPGYRPLGEGRAGPYDYAILPGTSGDEVLGWLSDNGFYTPPSSRELLRPYLDGRHNLVALKLHSGATTGQIVPVVIRSDEPDACVPLRLTAVAAKADMPVLVWIVGEARAVPANYVSVEPSWARLDFAQGGNNYDDLVSAAVDAAPGGMGFVTQFAGPTPDLGGAVYPPAVAPDPSVDVAALQEVQQLLDGRPYLTRLFTRISPGEMLDDPIFVENPDMPAVTNQLEQEVHVVCEGKPAAESPVRVEHPDGSELWFASIADLQLPLADGPAARRVVATGRSGPGVVLTENGEAIDAGHADPRGCGGCRASGSSAAWVVALSALIGWRTRGARR